MSRNVEVPLVKQHSTAATFKSRWLDARQCSSVHLHIVIASTGSPAGALTIEESNDPRVAKLVEAGYNLDTTSDTVSVADCSASDRVDVTGTGLTVSGANSTMVHILYPAAFVRVVYTSASGGGAAACDIYAQGKD